MYGDQSTYSCFMKPKESNMKQIEIPDFFIIEMFYFINCFEGPIELDEVVIFV